MFTQCPQCDAIFQLSASQLKAANGEVRCGQCLSVFSALEHLSEELPAGKEIDTSAEQAQDAKQYGRWSAGMAGDTNDSTAEQDNTRQTVPETSDDIEADIFNEIIIEADSHAIPAEEIERFEEFLAGDAEPLAGSPLTAELPSIDDVLETDDSQPAGASTHVDNTVQNDGVSPTDSVTDTFAATGMSPPPLVGESNTLDNDAPRLGDMDTATSDLDVELRIDDDDEFAELNAYLHGPDNERRDDISTLGGEPVADSDSIIIEEADLEPLTSEAYTDTPESRITEQSAETRPPVTFDENGAEIIAENAAETRGNESPQKTHAAPADKDTDPAPNIPSLILADLHAAKAEQLRAPTTPWMVGSLVLMLTLVLQVVYFSRDDLARDASLRPWLIQMCEVLGCTLTQPYDIKQIDIIGRDVRSHPSARNALVVSTTLINNADFVQPFPLLTMIFSDINGTTIAQRRFTPREYLHNTVDLAAGMTPDMPVRIELELVDPGKAAVNYEFRAEVDPRQTRPLA